MNAAPWSFRGFVLVLVTATTLSPVRAQTNGHEARARQILEAAGVKGGLVVHVGCGDGNLTAALRAGDSYLVQGLDRDTQNVEKAREHVDLLGLYGIVTVEHWTDGCLPYIDNLVNLVVSEDLADVSMDEVMRVLCPGGVAYVGQDGKWKKTLKSRPDEIDEWTHYLHGSDNNAVANDSVVASPCHTQWSGDPKWARHHNHLASTSAMVSSGGRLFAIVDEGPNVSLAQPAKWRLVARDACTGVILGTRRLGRGEGVLGRFRRGPAEMARRVVAVDETV